MRDRCLSHSQGYAIDNKTPIVFTLAAKNCSYVTYYELPTVHANLFYDYILMIILVSSSSLV